MHSGFRIQKKVETRARRLDTVWIDCPFPVVSLGLERVLELEGEFDVGYEDVGYEDGPATDCAPSVIVVHADEIEDVCDGLERAEQRNPEIPVVVFSIHISYPLAQAALRRGARGFIHAGMQPAQIVRALKVAAQGEIAVPRELVESLVKGEEGSPDLDALTPRQREILELVADGLSNAQIGKHLFLSESTIKQHLRSAYKILSVKNRTEAARLIRGSNEHSTRASAHTALLESSRGNVLKSL